MTSASTKTSSNGVVRISRKGVVKFAFGEDGPAFEVEVVSAHGEWATLDEGFRVQPGPDVKAEEVGTILDEEMPAYRAAMLEWVRGIAGAAYAPGADPELPPITPAEAFDFIARLREQYADLAHFFRARSREERASPGTSGEGSGSTSQTSLRFSTGDP